MADEEEDEEEPYVSSHILASTAANEYRELKLAGLLPKQAPPKKKEKVRAWENPDTFFENMGMRNPRAGEKSDAKKAAKYEPGADQREMFMLFKDAVSQRTGGNRSSLLSQLDSGATARRMAWKSIEKQCNAEVLRLSEAQEDRWKGNLWSHTKVLKSFAHDNTHYFETWNEDMSVDQFAGCLKACRSMLLQNGSARNGLGTVC